MKSIDYNLNPKIKHKMYIFKASIINNIAYFLLEA